MADRLRMGAGAPLRCAIYTRKSTEEGLDQDFNSLDAQREARKALRQYVIRVEVGPDAIAITVQLTALGLINSSDEPTVAEVPIGSVKVGKQLKLILSPGTGTSAHRPDPGLVKLLAQATALRQKVAETEASTFRDLASELGYSREYAADLLRVSFLAPDIQTRILDGSQPESLTRSALMKAASLPLDWSLQREALGFS